MPAIDKLWPAVPMKPDYQLAAATADIWIIPLDLNPGNREMHLASLGPEEQQRYNKLHKSKQDAYLVSHSACRSLLARYLDLPAEEISYRYNAHGKPALAPEHSLRFNLSHSHATALVALCQHHEIGVDIEYCADRKNYLRLAERFFHPSEMNFIAKQPEDDRLPAFYRLWAMKEACIKALGTGLATPLSSFSIIKDNEIVDPTSGLPLPADNPTGNWYLNQLNIIKNYKAALTCNTAIEQLRYFHY